MSAGISRSEWLDENEVATRTRTPKSTVRSWRQRGIGPAYCRVGRRMVYAVADVDAFILAGRIETTGVVTAPGPERPSAPMRDAANVTAVFRGPEADR